MSDRDRIEISWDDLGPETPPSRLPPDGSLPSLPTPPERARGSVSTRLGANSMVTGLVAGTLAGLLGTIVAKLVYEGWYSHNEEIQLGVIAICVGALLGFLLAGWPDLSSGAAERGLREGLIGLAIGGAAALVAVGVGDAIYDNVRADGSESSKSLALALAWTVIGVLGGAGLGLRGGVQKVANGALGGLVGGVAGGVLYTQLVGDEKTAFGPQLIAVTLTAIAIGTAIGVVERIRREAWLQVIGGPLAGKEFILYRDQVTLGSAAAADIVIPKDRQVHPIHVVISRSEGRVQVDARPGAPLRVNNQPVTQAVLKSGDTMIIGHTGLSYSER